MLPGHGFTILQTDAGVSGSHKVEQFIAVFTHEGLQMMTGDVVPFDAVLIEVVQNGQTGLVVTLGSFSVVGLRLSEATSSAPVTGISLGGGSNLSARSGPEPAVNVSGLQVWPVAAIEVTLAA